MKKKLDESGVLNELKGRSSFFPSNKPAPSERETTSPTEMPMPRETERKSVRKYERTEVRTENRTASLPIKRSTKRYSFEFYADQITTLKQLKRQAEDRGENLTLSDIAREALDDYLKDRK